MRKITLPPDAAHPRSSALSAVASQLSKQDLGPDNRGLRYAVRQGFREDLMTIVAKGLHDDVAIVNRLVLDRDYGLQVTCGGIYIHRDGDYYVSMWPAKMHLEGPYDSLDAAKAVVTMAAANLKLDVTLGGV